MSADLASNLFSLLLALPALIIGLTIHEFAHAWAADRLGDDLARREGRLTLDPLAHLDLYGSIFMIFAWITGFGVGWARPVPVHTERLRNPRRDSALVAVAGPVSNLLQLPVWLILIALFNMAAVRAGWGGSILDLVQDDIPRTVPAIVANILFYGFIVNVGMATFNMIPIPPLDGHWILASLSPDFVGQFFDTIRPFGFMILIVLLQVPSGDNSVLDQLMTPVYNWAYMLLYSVVRVTM